jgi:hypothetical protein
MLIHHIDIFSTVYVVNIAKALEKIINELNITTNLHIREITNEDIRVCVNDSNRYMFLFCPQWVYPTNINPLPKEKYFFYQLEQFDKSNSPHIFNPFVFLLMNNSKHIFDYSNINLKYYNEKQINISRKKISLLIPPVVNVNVNLNNDNKKPIDVLFCGCLSSPRRQFILESLKKNGINVTIVNNIFGNNLTTLIKKSKIFLNIRFSDSSILETCRLHEAIMSTDTYIVSEKPGSTLDPVDQYSVRINFIDIITDNTYPLLKTIKTILSLYDVLKPPKFNSLPMTTNIKQSLINVFTPMND